MEAMPKRNPGETLTDHRAKLLAWMGWKREQDGSISNVDEDLSPDQMHTMMALATPTPIPEELQQRTLESIRAVEREQEILAITEPVFRRGYQLGILVGILIASACWFLLWLAIR
jgi:hypothetical protein